MVELYVGFSEFVIYLSALLAVLACFFYRKLDTKLKVFIWYIVISGFVDLVAEYFGNVYGNNLWLLHIFTVLEISILGFFFSKIIKALGSNIPIRTITTIIALICITNTFLFQPINTFNSYSSTLVSLTLIIFCVMTFYLLLDYTGNDFIHIKGIVAGILIYQMPTFLVLSSANIQMELSNESVSILWLSRAIFIFISKLIYLYFLYKAYSEPKLKMI